MIRVIMERRVKKGHELDFREIVSEIRGKALHQPGYITGETWVGYDDPSLNIIIATWIGIELWQAWEASAERRAMIAKMEPFLESPTKTQVLRSSGEVEVDWDIRMHALSKRS